MKTCKICGIEKDESEFYFNTDRIHLKPYCIPCHKKKSVDDHNKKGNEYFKRHDVKIKMKLTDQKHRPERKEYFREYNKIYSNNFPEKMSAHYESRNIIVTKGMVKHHWNYNPEYYTDIIEISYSNHNIIHNRLIYDQEYMMFRGLDGILLNTKERHSEYINSLI